MTIKSDRWIKQQALENEMITPFVEHLVRVNKYDERVISFGLSSYGYDIRLADEYKVFTNAHGNIVVDPKNFDERSFVDVKDQGYCIIPPNSFALGRSVEYIRMPRNVTGLVLGKSSYARCFTGDTRVALVDGTNPTFEEMVQRDATGELFWGYGLNKYGRVVVVKLETPRYISSDYVLEIELDTGERIKTTGDHIFITREGLERQAYQLKPRMALMPLYRKIYGGYEEVYQPSVGYYNATHVLADYWNLDNSIYIDEPNTHRHHKDHNRLNNNPWNIMRMDGSEHIRYHNTLYYGENFDTHQHSSAIKKAFTLLKQDSKWIENYRSKQQERALQFWADENYTQIRQGLSTKKKAAWTDEKKAQAQSHMLRHYEDSENRSKASQISKTYWANATEERHEQQAAILRELRTRKDITEEKLVEALSKTGSIRGAAQYLNCDRSVFRRFPQIIAQYKNSSEYKNHKIVSIKELKGQRDVYCLSSPETANFGLAAGVFVHNCGIVANFTPLESLWHGYITIEISNTSPLPAKVYSNEGFAQILFLESDEDCLVSYADRGGKYQGQTGITLARV